MVATNVFLAGSRPTRPEIALARGLLRSTIVDALIGVVVDEGLRRLIRLAAGVIAAFSGMVRVGRWWWHLDL